MHSPDCLCVRCNTPECINACGRDAAPGYARCDHCLTHCECGEALTLAGDCDACGLAALDAEIAAHQADDVAHQLVLELAEVA